MISMSIIRGLNTLEYIQTLKWPTGAVFTKEILMYCVENYPTTTSMQFKV